MDILDKTLCLSLNASWQAIGQLSIRKAIVAMCSEQNGQKAALGLDLEMVRDDSGEDTLAYANPVSWDQWIELPVRENDLFIQTVNRKIRAPTVIVSAHYNRVPLKRPRLSAGAIWERDGGVCQYTGQKVTRATGNLDHVIPRDRGGKDEWTNLVLASKELNSRKGNRLNHEVGLTLIRAPKAPPALPVSVAIQEARHATWAPFLIKG